MKTLMTAFLVGCCLMVARAPAAAKTYTVNRIESEVIVRRDGSIQVGERITFAFRGSFSFAYRDIPLKAGERLSDVRVSEDGVDYSMTGTEQAGTFSLEERSGTRRVTWHYRARDQQRTFVLRYTLGGVVKRYPDVAETYVQFVGDQWDRGVGSVQARLQLPGGILADDVRAWAHGPLHGAVEVLGDNELAFDVAPLPAGMFWEGRIVVPAEFFEGVPVTGTSPRLEQILAEEATWAAEANRRREALQGRMEEASRELARKQARRPVFLLIAIGLGVMGWGMWTRLFMRYGRPHHATPLAAVGEVPSEHSPALLAYLMHRTVMGSALVATLLDLANRGYFEIREQVLEKKNRLGRPKMESDFRFERTAKDAADLAPHEADLVEFLSTEAGDAGGFSMQRLKDVASKDASKFHTWFLAWSKRVGEAGKQARFFEPHPAGAMMLNALTGVCIMVAGILLCVFSASPVGLPAAIVGLVQALLTAALQRRTPEGRRLLVEWRAFKRHLQSIASALGPVTLDSREWGRYLAAALIFGMHKELIPRLRVAEEGAAPAVYPVWYHAALQGDSGSGLTSLGAGFSSMVDAVSSTVSNASGIGGGDASGGGGGGSGGGGGGAG